MEDINAIVQLLQAIGSASGPWAIVGIVLTGAIRIIRLPLIQGILGSINPALAWDKWPIGVKLGLPFALAFLGVFLPGLLVGGLGVGTAIVAALAAALTAIGSHVATKEAGAAMTEAAVAKNPAYQPGTIRQAVGIALPIDKKKLMEKMMSPLP